MSIDAIGPATPYAPVPKAAAAAPFEQSTTAQVVQQILQQEEQKGGGGGGKHGVKKSGLDAISQLAAAVVNKPKPSKTMQQRIDEIKRLKKMLVGQRAENGDKNGDKAEDELNPDA
ncbi:MAG: hypothetical protein JOY59_04360 [Candidatus Eremiobacteraeota bacterium]|nr:hypothetical protein [Candidatus Eremiobacteraeota bacterium]